MNKIEMLEKIEEIDFLKLSSEEIEIWEEIWLDREMEKLEEILDYNKEKVEKIKEKMLKDYGEIMEELEIEVFDLIRCRCKENKLGKFSFEDVEKYVREIKFNDLGKKVDKGMLVDLLKYLVRSKMIDFKKGKFIMNIYMERYMNVYNGVDEEDE